MPHIELPPAILVLQEDSVRKISVVMDHADGAPDLAPDFDPDYELSIDAQIRAVAVEEAIRLQRAEAEA